MTAHNSPDGTPGNTPDTTPDTESTDSPMNQTTHDTANATRPYPASGSSADPMADLLADKTVPILADPSSPGSLPDARATAHAQDATTTESFGWTGTEWTGPAVPPANSGATSDRNASWTQTVPLAPPLGAAPAATADPRGPRPARAGTIVWGCILFLIAALAAVPAVLGDAVLSPTTFLWIVVGFGTLLVVGGIVGAIVSAATRRSRADRTPTM